jgi:hypothetical protein
MIYISRERRIAHNVIFKKESCPRGVLRCKNSALMYTAYFLCSNVTHNFRTLHKMALLLLPFLKLLHQPCSYYGL